MPGDIAVGSANLQVVALGSGKIFNKCMFYCSYIYSVAGARAIQVLTDH